MTCGAGEAHHTETRHFGGTRGGKNSHFLFRAHDFCSLLVDKSGVKTIVPVRLESDV
jgi:hypothetical protein